MYAVFEDGSRQYRVSQGDVVTIDYRKVDPGSRLEMDQVVLCADGDDVKIGQPFLEGMRVVIEVVEETSVKTYSQKFRRRKNSRRFNGHRQHYIRGLVKHILMPGQEAPAETEEEKPEEKAEAAPTQPEEQPISEAPESSTPESSEATQEEAKTEE